MTRKKPYVIKGNILLEKLEEFEQIMVEVADETGEELMFKMDEQQKEKLEKCFDKINEIALKLGVKKTAYAFLCFSLSHSEVATNKEKTELQEFIENIVWGNLDKINNGKFAEQVDKKIMNILHDDLGIPSQEET